MEATGQFTDSPDGAINWLSYDRERAYIYDLGQTWRLGVSSLTFGGTYAPGMGSDLNYWFRNWDHRDDPSVGSIGAFVSAPDAPGAWSNGLISAKGFEAWVNWNDAVTGIAGADLKGTFDPTNKTWQAVALWAWMDTGTFMNLALTDQGIEKLNALNIPCIDIGKTSLLQAADTTVNNLQNVFMNDVTFFAYSTGAKPRIWATKDVGGDYLGTPSTTGPAVSLSGGHGLSADFQVKRWDGPGGNWGANVTGGGTYTGTGTMNGMNVQMKGAAAGKIDNPSPGKFAGTGSGVAGPPTPVD